MAGDIEKFQSATLGVNADTEFTSNATALMESARARVDAPEFIAKRFEIRNRSSQGQAGSGSEVPVPQQIIDRLLAKVRAYRYIDTSAPVAARSGIPGTNACSFVIQVKQPTSLSELQTHAVKTLGRSKSDDISMNLNVLESSGIYLEELFPGASTTPGAEELAQFFVLTFAVPSALLNDSAYDITYALRLHLDLAYVRPVLPSSSPTREIAKGGNPDAPDPGPPPRPGPRPPAPPGFDCAWSLRYMNVPSAWALPPPAGGAQFGAGILIGHPDTGWHPHMDVNAGFEINTGLGWNTLDLLLPWDRHNAVDPLQIVPLEINRGHGTTCASLAVSRGGVTAYNPKQPMSGTTTDASGPRVAGVAPGATIVPVRCTNQVFITETVNPAFSRALYYAAFNANVDVITCSLGILIASQPLDVIAAVLSILARNIIFIAAAGQTDLNLIPVPASFPGVVAVTGSDSNGGQVGNTGAKVAIAAPALDIYEASFSFDGFNNPTAIRERLPNVATSFATAQVAGVAALWVAFHGKQNLLNLYPNVALYRVFLSMLPQCVTTPAGWNTANSGPGIIDALKLLSQPLPPPTNVPALQGPLPRGMTAMQTLHPALSAAEILARFSLVFNTSASQTEILLEVFEEEISSLMQNHYDLSSNAQQVSAFDAPVENLVSLVEQLRATLLLYGSQTLQSAVSDGTITSKLFLKK
jgi:hypothetical protein